MLSFTVFSFYAFVNIRDDNIIEKNVPYTNSSVAKCFLFSWSFEEILKEILSFGFCIFGFEHGRLWTVDSCDWGTSNISIAETLSLLKAKLFYSVMFL